jgi:DedD protein
VQVGAFSSADGARKLVRDLKAAGFSAYVLAPAAGKKLHRVRVGPVADRAAADQLASKLKSRGLPVAVTADG